MPALDCRPVFAKQPLNRSPGACFESAQFFFVRHTSDCPICLCLQTAPQMLPCGHVLCCACVEALRAVSTQCPVCNACFWETRPARLIFYEGITEYVLLRRLTTELVVNRRAEEFFSWPFACEYLISEVNRPVKSSGEEVAVGASATANNVFYQAADGQLCFLDPVCMRYMRKQPEFLYGRVRSARTVRTVARFYSELAHIPDTISVTIVKLHGS